LIVKSFIKRAEKYNLPVSQVYDLISFMLGIDYSKAKYAHNKEIDNEKAEYVLSLLEKREPAAYITGRREFYGREFIINHNTLIPRVETEILIEEVIKRYRRAENIELIDICSGSGAIGLTLMQELNISFLTLLDIDDKALEVSKQNADKFNITKNIEFVCSDILNYTTKQKYDIVVCNPPYISENEYDLLQEEVKKEPYHALVADDNGLIFYKKILSNFENLCKSNGIIFFEIGAYQAGSICDYAAECNLYAECVKDYINNDRVIVVKNSKRGI
jgi:release factor glutamine methyltransferase